jgi:hypothetical protein
LVLAFRAVKERRLPHTNRTQMQQAFSRSIACALNSSRRHRQAAAGKVLPLEIFEESLFEFLSMVEFRSCFLDHDNVGIRPPKLTP